MSFANFLEDELLDHVWGAAAYTAPTDIYVGLSTTAPADDGTNITEPSGGNGYARVQVTNNLTNWPAASGGAKSNGTAVAFPTATGSWGTVTHMFFSDAASGGSILGSSALTTAKTVDTDDTVTFAIGDLDITLD
jgi:hypothetical protein